MGRKFSQMVSSALGSTALVLSLLSLSSCTLVQMGFSWERSSVDGSRTGVKPSGADDVAQKMGTYKDGVYTAPNGRTFSEGVTPEVARILLEAQPIMADLKTVIATCPEGMPREYPECALGDWYIDFLMEFTAKKVGRRVDFGLANFGGIRVDMPKGDVLKDDIYSMFPFRNKIVYLELAGKDIRAILDQLAATSWQVVGGGRFVVRDGKLESAEIGGEPLDDNKVYGVATISFLLAGGDDIFMARNARKQIILDEYILDAVYPHVLELTKEGKNIEYKTDGRIKILRSDGSELSAVRM